MTIISFKHLKHFCSSTVFIFCCCTFVLYFTLGVISHPINVRAASYNYAQKSQIEKSQISITSITFQDYLNNISKTKQVSSIRLNKLIFSKSNKPFYLYVGFKECPYCRRFSPKLKQFMNQPNVPRVYYLNADTFDQKSNYHSKAFKKVMIFLVKKVKLKTTPTIVAIRKGRIIGTFRSSKTTLRQLNKLNAQLINNQCKN